MLILLRLALATGLVIVGFVIWKYLINKRFKNSPSDSKLRSQSSVSSKSFSKTNERLNNPSSSQSNSQTFMYMPLNNNELFSENQIDENTIQVK